MPTNAKYPYRQYPQHWLKHHAAEKESRLARTFARKVRSPVRKRELPLTGIFNVALIFFQMTGFLMTLKGLPSTYNKDLQEDKEPLFDAVDNISACLKIAEGVIATMNVNMWSDSYSYCSLFFDRSMARKCSKLWLWMFLPQIWRTIWFAKESVSWCTIQWQTILTPV